VKGYEMKNCMTFESSPGSQSNQNVTDILVIDEIDLGATGRDFHFIGQIAPAIAACGG
jgi:hypothetical protein